MCTPLYNETLRGCFTVGEKKKYQKIDDEWRACDRMEKREKHKEKSIKDVVVENICYD